MIYVYNAKFQILSWGIILPQKLTSKTFYWFPKSCMCKYGGMHGDVLDKTFFLGGGGVIGVWHKMIWISLFIPHVTFWTLPYPSHHTLINLLSHWWSNYHIVVTIWPAHVTDSLVWLSVRLTVWLAYLYGGQFGLPVFVIDRFGLIVCMTGSLACFYDWQFGLLVCKTKSMVWLSVWCTVWLACLCVSFPLWWDDWICTPG